MKYDMSYHQKSSDEEPKKSVKEMLAEFQSKLDYDDNRFRKPPAPPAHRRAPPPPPPPPHRKLSAPPPLAPPPSIPTPSPSIPPDDDVENDLEETLKQPENEEIDEFQQNSELRKSLGPKPKLAPKPLFLNGNLLPTSSSTSDIPTNRHPDIPPPPPRSACTTPTILVSPATSDYSNGGFFDSNCENGGTNVKDKARQLVNLGFVPRRSNGDYSTPVERPISQVSSTLSQVSDEFDDGGDTTDEELNNEEKQLKRHRHEDDFDEIQINNQRKTTSALETTHSGVIQQMESLMRDKQSKTNGKKPQRRQSNIDEIPSDVGKLRDNRKGRHNSLFPVPSSEYSSQSTDDRSSIVSSSTVSNGAESAGFVFECPPIPDYDTGSEEEDQRLKKLHYAAVEFLKVQANYVQYLKEMAELYPEFLKLYSVTHKTDNLLGPHNGQENVVLQIKKILLQILPIHEMLLKEVDTVCQKWDSQKPNMSKAIGMYADFLKCCQPFLDKKAEIIARLVQLRQEDRVFDEATYQFELKKFKRGKKGAVIQQLDQVHQNFMRYKLLMLRYSEYLVPGSEEKKNAEEAIAKLESVTQTVNQKMGLPTTDDLTKLYYRFQCQFNVLEPGRVLIRQGDVLKQTRKEEQPRFLVLFTDCLWICRVSMSLSASGGQFEMPRSYRIPLEYMRFERMEDDEYVKCLMVRSKVKSALFIFQSEKERNAWADDLAKAQFERKSYKKRKSNAAHLHDDRLHKMGKVLLENGEIQESKLIIPEDPMMRPQMIGGASRSESGSQDELSSVPVTPLDNGQFDDGNGIFEGIIQKNGGGSKKQAVADVIKPVWLPDNASNECLMEGCSTEFNLIMRRHHCRDCGWLICKYCKGQAPLAKYEFRKENVCSECYDKQFETYKAGTLFPTRNIVIQSDGTHMVKIGKRDQQEVVDPRKLFKAPVNFGFRHRNVDEKRAGAIVFGKVHLSFRNRKSELIRYALLRRDDLKLVFHKAELDSKSVFEVLIYGYFYREIHLDDGNGWIFELIHRNQIRTDDTKDDVISFRVDNETSAKKWSAAFADKLEMDPTFKP
ncbi:hypothetical protein L5515_012390 [Caenorhabditis briggsae]|uniref:Protein CBR-TAG-77 n=1 Tax=Caenorhabditis briggsae TaxID=6238 RepID=A0AAE9EZ99_CAEBR|nr:hypothetical protein L5515_012390 [Caenorhabditis briggsae]